MTSDEQPPEHRKDVPVPRPSTFLFAAAFVVAMAFNLFWDATHAEYAGEKVTMFLGTATLLILGVDVGKMIGRR